VARIAEGLADSGRKWCGGRATGRPISRCGRFSGLPEPRSRHKQYRNQGGV